MAERRSLSEGIKNAKAADPQVEEAFVYGKPANNSQSQKTQIRPPAPDYREDANGGGLMNRGRVLLSARVLPELAAILKRISLEHQLAGKEPSSQQEIIEIALTDWLRKHGHM